MSRFVTDLGEMEGDYRVFYLKDDIVYGTIYISIAIIGLLSMIRMDALLTAGRPDLFAQLMLYRGIYILVSILAMIVLRKTGRVKVYDRIVLGWLSFTVVYFLLLNFMRPANYLSTISDIIIPFAIYVFSPLKISYNFVLAFGFSIGTLLIDYFYKTGIDPVRLNAVAAAQIVIHTLGVVSGSQIQSYRRKAFKAYVQEKDARETAAYLANIDSLTKSLTRRHFFSIAESEFLRFRRYHRRLSVLVMDADHFKNINDTYGHYAGDLVLRNVSLITLEQKRAQDTFGRLGGEEFALLLPETNLEQAKVVAERIQKMWGQTPCMVDGTPIYSTVSIGAAEAGAEDKSLEDVLRRADRLMYKAKESGGNRVAAG